MKSVILFGAFTLLTVFNMNAQDQIFAMKIKKSDVPAVVITSIEKDFPGGTVTDYTSLPVDVIGEQVFVHMDPNLRAEDYDTYNVAINGKNFNGYAMYDKKGRLLQSREVLKSIELPYSIGYFIGKNYPGWAVASDREVITTHANNKQQIYYRVKLTKGKEAIRLTLDAHGNIADKEELQ